jgi:hypothetical protein
MSSTTTTEPPQVIAEVLAGDGLSLAEAARVVPSFRPGKPTHGATVWRWAAKGVRLPNGQLVKLETCRIGGRQMTSRAALGRFIEAQTPPADTDPGPTPVPPTPAKRKQAATRASEELNRIGI